MERTLIGSMKITVFCDFDGTVSRRDVGYHLFRHFSGGRTGDLVAAWKAGELSTRECLRREASLCRAIPEEIYEFLDQITLDRGFEDFTVLCEVNGVDLVILSDGLDFYIEHILGKHGLDHLTISANHGSLEDNTVKVEFPRENRSCQRCGSCKGERIQEYRDQAVGDLMAIFVGDGLSDVCAAREADLVFAKKDLEQFCLNSNIDYVPYDNFDDVARHLLGQGLLTNGKDDGLAR